MVMALCQNSAPRPGWQRAPQERHASGSRRARGRLCAPHHLECREGEFGRVKAARSACPRSNPSIWSDCPGLKERSVRIAGGDGHTSAGKR